MPRWAHLLCMAVISLAASAQDTFSADGLTYSISSPSTVTVVPGKVDFRGRSSYAGDVVVPAFVRHNGKKYKVTAIGEGAFNCKRLSSLTISEGVLEIEEYAICVENIGSLTITGSVKVVPYCFVQNISSLSIGEGVETLSGLDMYGPAEIVIPASVRQISASFSGRTPSDKSQQNSMRRQKISFLGKPTKISYSFTRVGIESLNVAADTICGSFLDCPFLSDATLTSGTNVIDGSFSRCDNLSSISLPESLKLINGSFANLPSLESIAIPDSVTQIKDSFRGTNRLHYLSLGTGWARLSESPHIISNHTKTVYMPWPTPPDFSANVWYGVKDVTIYVPDRYLEKYEEAKKRLTNSSRFNVFHFKGTSRNNFIFPPVQTQGHETSGISD